MVKKTVLWLFVILEQVFCLGQGAKGAPAPFFGQEKGTA
jgi:hypothetical protein